MVSKAAIRWCAVYTRKSSEDGLEQGFNSLDAQREAAAAYIKSQRHEGWREITQRDWLPGHKRAMCVDCKGGIAHEA